MDYIKRLLADDNGEPNLKLHTAFFLIIVSVALLALDLFKMFTLNVPAFSAILWLIAGCLGISEAGRVLNKLGNKTKESTKQ